MALQYDKIILFGDSITEYAYNIENGFCVGPALQNLYTRKLDVIQRGYGGYNSDHASAMVDTLIKQETTPTSAIKLMIVFFGTNDSVLSTNTIQHVPIERLKSNLRKIYDSCTKAGIKTIFIAPGPFNANQWRIGREDRPSDRTTLRAREYCDAVIEVGKELNVPVVPMWYAIMADLGWKEGEPIHGLIEQSAENPLVEYLNDGLHYTGKGYKVEYDGLLKAIKENYEELDAESLPRRMPHWEDIKSIDILNKSLE